jgi:hypothetical protein
MHYVSTRGGGAPATFLDILLGGLMPDGGLVTAEEGAIAARARIWQERMK